MKVKRISVRRQVKAQVLLVRLPGVGKTSIVKECFRKNHSKSITLQLAKPLTKRQIERLYSVCCGRIDILSNRCCGKEFITLGR